MAGEIRLLAGEEAHVYALVLRDSDVDSGQGGGHFHPYSADTPFVVEEVADRARRCWARGLDETGWRRAWGWWMDEQLVGHVTLTGGGLATELHRARLGVGVLPASRGSGGGTALMETAMAWARKTPEIAWIDLGVFSDNPRALGLYERLGFAITGYRGDRYRIDGVSVGNTSMSLRVEG